MNIQKFPMWILIIGIVAVLFSGTLSYSSMVLGKCILKDPCPEYFNIPVPACFYGFVMFVAILALTILAMMKKDKMAKMMNYVFYVSILGVLFSAFSTAYQLFYVCPLQGGCTFSLLMPTCFYGLIMFTLVFLMSKSLMKK